MKAAPQSFAQKFEIIILRPLQIIYIILTVFFIFKGLWLYVGGAILCLFYLGIVGAKLHPLQSSSDLAQGPLRGSSAVIESILLPPEMLQTLVGHACTRIGLLIGLSSGVVLWGIASWHWYFAIIAIWIVTIMVGASLKVMFKTV